MPSAVQAAIELAFEMPWLGGLVAGMLVGGAHFLAHRFFAAEHVLERGIAGVRQAGLTVAITTALVVWIVLVVGGGA